MLMVSVRGWFQGGATLKLLILERPFRSRCVHYFSQNIRKRSLRRVVSAIEPFPWLCANSCVLKELKLLFFVIRYI
jgi:hypothetical protein